MDQILLYGDSLSWGIIPGTRQRSAFEQRWPGVLEAELCAAGASVRVIENCLNGRRSAWSDPVKEGRNGCIGVQQVIEMHSPLAWVIVMLGSNDFQAIHDNDARQSASGIKDVLELIREAPVEPGMPLPRLMLIAPPAITEPKGAMADKFQGAEQRCCGLASELASLAEEQSILFMDAGAVTAASAVDGIHLDIEQHRVLGQAVAQLLLAQLGAIDS